MKILFFQKNQNKELLESAFIKLTEIRDKSDILAICAQPTGYSWLGVNVATKSLFPECTFEIPQFYSNPIYSNIEISKLCNKINELSFKQLIFSGFAPFYQQICDQLDSGITQKLIYHGFLAELSDNLLQQEILNKILTLVKQKKIKAIGFVKKGLGLSFSKLLDIPTYEIILPNKYLSTNTKSLDYPVKIGCLVNTSFRKNIHNQAFAASLVPNAEIHVFKTQELKYIDKGQFIYHDLMNHDAFINLLSSMTINLHVTFSESWGQVLSESISQGVPCISANTSSFFDYDEDLKRKLVVDGFDDSWQINRRIEEVLGDYEVISNRCISYTLSLNSIASERLREFTQS